MRDTTTGQPVFRDDLGTATYGELVEAMRSDENFGRYRREYGRYGNEAAAVGATAPPPPPAAPPPGGGGPPPPVPPSDIRLKRNIRYVSTTSDGIILYEFQYLWSDQIYVGVMAQDLLLTHPDAVILYPDGFYRVDYTMLGMEMMTREEFNASVSRHYRQ
jgi:hypothetical protein